MTRKPDEVYRVPALEGEAEIVVDPWGVAHIRASSTYDAFVAQGFNAARDRLWQIDLWRRRGLGRLAEVFGPSQVRRDRAARLFLYRGDMRTEWLSYGSDAKRVTTAFVAGINAFVELTRRNPSLLPREFQALGYEPDRWSPSDIPRMRSHGVYGNLREEVARAITLRDYGRSVEELRRKREPANELNVPEGLDLDLIPDDVLRDYDLAMLPPVFAEGLESVPPPPGMAPEGSNNWALRGERTRSGRPLLANDPHRAAAQIPGLRYIVHLSSPAFDVIGGGEPGLPGVSIGHNGRIAFGLTTFSVDQEDLYVYETNPHDPLEYRYQGRWERMRVERETILVKGGEPVEVELHFTRHGPVIHSTRERNVAFALRAAWLEPGMAPYLASLESMRATDWDGFLNAMNRWGSPPLNHVYADASGNIGWKPAGLVPRRPNWDGTLPVPGDGRYEWAGFHDNDELPVSFNPERGYVASANEMNLPPGHPLERAIGFDWFAPYRRHRIGEYLDSRDRFELQDMVRLQNDVLSVPAREILRWLRTLPFEYPEAVPGLSMLLAWDANLHADSAAAALFEVWYRWYLRPALKTKALERLIPSERIPAALKTITVAEDFLADARVDLDMLRNPAQHFGPDSARSLATVVQDSLRRAFAELSRMLGPDPAGWRWGSIHVARATHPLALLLTALPEACTTTLSAPRGGSGDTVCDTAYGPDFVQASGATFRVAIDVGGWDESLAMNAPGQSGEMDSPHYTDLFDPWARGESFPLLFSRDRVDAVARKRIRLTPR